MLTVGMMKLDFSKLERKTASIVKAAAKIMERGTGKIHEKAGAANLVTDADLSVQCFLQNRLRKLLPRSGFLCEEENVADADKELLWVIDPIDGTTNFARGIPECAISVGLLYKMEPVLGVVYAPRLKLLFTAVKGKGAFCCGKPIRTSEKTFAQALFCTGLCVYQKELSDRCSAIIAQTYPLCSDIRRFGSCALELCYLAMGRCDLLFEIRTYPWDYAAGYVILTEAGGVLRGYHGQTLDFESMTMLLGANNAANFEKLDQIVSDNITEPPVFKE